MGRLRNLSESWKSFRDPNASVSTLSRPSPDSRPTTTIVDKDSPPHLQVSPAEPPRTSPRTQRSASRPTSMMYTPPSMEVGRDNQIEELVPVFSFLSSHSNKLYQEGYFLKLNDLDTHGRPNADRNWTECFAQLVGTVLSLWDAAALDAAGQDGEVAPTFINLADASLKMIETLPTRNPDVQPLQNVLSISTAGKNRYLLHFNSLHSLTQWTAGIRLAMFEHTSLQELYTGSLIAGKGKYLNNIKTIMERSRFATEDWARVRFGAGTPWRRCWCVIEPPDEKEWQKANKSLKKKSAYDRPPPPPKGVIKFYDTKKTKKVTPIATITDAYSAYAIYPQSKPLIDQSTLVKLEGRITIHSKPESKTEGFVFVMPELHPAVSGFEMMLRWLFPVYDTFHLYGRPGRMVADTWDVKGLMFAMPKERHYGYLDIIDVAALIHTAGSEKWNEREWRKQMKEMTSKRMGMGTQARSSTNMDNRGHIRNFSEQRQGVRYSDQSPTPSTSNLRNQASFSPDAGFGTPQRPTQAPTNGGYLAPVQSHQSNHNRSVSESVAYVSPTKNRQQKENQMPSRLSSDYVDQSSMQSPPVSPIYPPQLKNNSYAAEREANDSRYSSDSDGQGQRLNREDIGHEVRELTPPAPVVAPPTFQHHGGEIPQKRPDARPDLRREKSRMSNATLSQMADVNKMAAIGNSGAAGHAAVMAWNGPNGAGPPPAYNNTQGPRGVIENPNHHETEVSANQLASAATTTATVPPATAAATLVLADYLDDSCYTQSPVDIKPENDQTYTTEHSSTENPKPPSRRPLTSEKTLVTRKPVPVRQSLPLTLTPPNRSRSAESMSEYSVSSCGSPNYDSPPEDLSPSLLPQRRRTGVLKTVGDPTLGDTTAESSSINVDIPAIDFGTTYTPALTPGHSRPPTALGLSGRSSPLDNVLPPTAPASPSAPSSNERPSPVEEKRGSYAERPGSSPLSGHGRSSSQAWRAGTVLGRHSPAHVITAEDFVQQRAAAVRAPHGYAPQRSTSYSKMEQSPNKLPHRRESGSRPPSRASLLNEYPSHLTAREQEHVARMTGGPLIYVGERSRTPDPSIGLIGAIEAREQEKRNMKDGLAGHMVQEAIAQRQAVDRVYGSAQYSNYGPGGESRHRGSWSNLQSPSNQWGVFGNSVSPQQQPWSGSPSPYQQQGLNQRRHSGYFSTQEGYGRR